MAVGKPEPLCKGSCYVSLCQVFVCLDILVGKTLHQMIVIGENLWERFSAEQPEPANVLSQGFPSVCDLEAG